MTFGDTVYLKTDPFNLPRVVTGRLERPGGSVQWGLTHAIEPETWHYDSEIIQEAPVKKKGFLK